MRGSLRQEMGMQEGNQFSMSYKDDHHHQQQKAKIGPDVEAHQALKCPRCDSPNTKFCYYNNYNLTQPRHFCKTCRRYWTKGGALRNVPVGGGCRKNKRSRQRSKDRIPLTVATDHHHSNPNPNPQGSSSPGSNLSLMQNLWGASNSSILDLVVDHQQPPVPPMAGLVYENPAFGFEPASFGNLSEDIMQWRIQQQSKLAALQQHLDGNSIRGLNHGNANDSNGVDLMLISSANDQKYSDHEHDRHHHHYQQHQQQQQKGKSIASSDLQAEWPAMADCLLEESTSAY